ncbi:protein disulfide isomerase, putative [Plasmodium ovale]|uniref:Protein disulfide isomerase, putative n=1 Tax=Plasmodium ovale TaxID=36330 RepID=A0A1D3TI42_PLAOA|nr:protein disulfide isomerase, putative [Plasmodium ovale]
MINLFIVSFLFFFLCNANAEYAYPQHEVLNVDTDNIERVFETNEYWLIKFYAPQCVYCQRIWNKVINLKTEIQNENKRKIYFGEVNCECKSGRSICEKYAVFRIPQLKLFKGSELISTYSNNMSDENFMKKWIYYVTTPVFQSVDSEEELNSYKSDDSLFLTCSDNLNDVVIRVAKQYNEECYFINIKNQELCDKLKIGSSQLHVREKYEHATYNLDKVDFEQLNSFVNKNRFPIVRKVDHYSFFNLRSSGNNLILLLLDLEREPNTFISQFTEYAKRYRNLNEYIFAYIDGKYYEENLELYGTDSRKYPQIIVFSKQPHEYYFEDYFYLGHMNEIIDGITNGRIKPKDEEFTKTRIFLVKLKKHMDYIFEKAFKTDLISFIGFLCAVVMIILTSVLVINTIYKFINKSEAKHSSEKKKIEKELKTQPPNWQFNKKMFIFFQKS